MSTSVNPNARWRAIVRLFPAWALPFDMFFNAGTYRFMGSDLLQSMRSDWRVKRALKLLADCSAQEVAALEALAALNERRCNDAFKAVAVAYITVPIALVALVSDAAPEVARAAIVANVDSIAPIVIAFVLTPVVYFFGFWRAKQLTWAIEMFRAEGLASDATLPSSRGESA